ncbi:MAG: sulfite exporter TauE/SafE family protein [Faecalibacillus sp.]
MFSLMIYAIAGLGAGIGTGLAGLSAASVISPMLICFLDFNPYHAVGVALASDVLASAASSYTYYKNGNIDMKHGIYMLISVLCFTMVGSYIASLVSQTTMGNLSVYMTMFLGIKFIVKPVMTSSESLNQKSEKERIIQSVICGIFIGFICGFIGAGGGMMMLMILTMVIGYELKMAVGTSVFIMTFTALTGALSHFMIGGIPDMMALMTCVIFTLIGALLAARFANKAEAKKLNQVTGVVLFVLGFAMLVFKFL